MRDAARAGLVCAALLVFFGSIYSIVKGPFPHQAWLGGLTVIAALFALRAKRQPNPEARRPPVHFPGLNALRFIAAFLVYIHHVEQVKLISGLDSLWKGKSLLSPLFLRAGALGVTFFFVLSGFLITYLLLVEVGETRSISLKDFYIRRALRIWPVYFFLTAFAFTILPRWHLVQPATMIPVLHAHYFAKLSLFLLMWVHVFEISYPGIFPGGVLWTVSVEEHFYFVWPLLIRILKGKIFPALAGIVVALVLSKASAAYLAVLHRCGCVHAYVARLQNSGGVFWILQNRLHGNRGNGCLAVSTAKPFVKNPIQLANANRFFRISRILPHQGCRIWNLRRRYIFGIIRPRDP